MAEQAERKKGQRDRKPPQEPRKPYKPPKVTPFGGLKNVTLGGGCGCGTGA